MPGPLTLGEIAARLGDRLLGGAGVLIEQAGAPVKPAPKKKNARNG